MRTHAPTCSATSPATRAATLLAILLPIAVTTAQGDFDFDKSAPATFAKTLQLDYRAAPANRPMMFMLSLNGGPTALRSLFGGSDPRSIEVGTDLVPTWLLTSTTPAGAGSFRFTVPSLASLQGLPIHLQLMTGGGAGPHLVDKISNKIVVVAGRANTTSTLAAQLGDGRNPIGPGRGLMAVFPIAGSQGRIMLAGGGTGNILGARGLQTTEIYDSRQNRISAGPNMLIARALATATVLSNGRVLMAGGVDNLGNPTASCEIYDPATNRWTATGSMTSRRAGHAAALLNDGRVLVVAGTRDLADIAKAIAGILRSAEIYNPSTGRWTATASIGTAVLGPALTTLANGRVLVSGGAKINRFIGIPTSVRSITNCQLFDPSTNRWSNTGSLRKSRAVHARGTIRLTDGRVLVLGGITVNIGLIPPPSNFAGAQAIADGEFYNPNTGSWTSLPSMASARSGHAVNQMGNGRVLVSGGATGAIDAAVAVNTIQEFNPSTNTFVRTFTMRAARATHGTTVLPDGSLVLFGGTTGSGATASLKSIELVHK